MSRRALAAAFLLTLLAGAIVLERAQPPAAPRPEAPAAPTASPPPQRSPGSWIQGETAHYTIRLQSGHRKRPAARSERQVLEDLKARMELLFEKYAAAFHFRGPLARKARLTLYGTRAAYEASGAPADSAAYYRPGAQELVGYEDEQDPGATFHALCHEGCHQFFDLAFPGFYRSREVPVWFSEGLADCFGASEIRGSELFVFGLGGIAARRIADLRSLPRTGGLTPLRRLLTMGPSEFMSAADRHYAEAWSFVHFLWNYPGLDTGRGIHSEIVVRLIEGFKAGKPRDAAYEEAFRFGPGSPRLDALDAEWRSYVETLKGRR